MNPPSIRIRRAVPSDLPFIEAIEQICFPETRRSSRRALQHSLYSHHQSVWLALGTPGRNPAGVMILHHHQTSVRIFSLAVLPAFRKNGVGRLLVNKAMERARRTGKSQVSLEADLLNPALTAWYERQGFFVTGRINDYYAPGAPAVRMCKPLKKPRFERKVHGGRS